MSASWILLCYMILHLKRFKEENFRRLCIVTLLYFLVVGMSTPLMIHKRYRIIYDLFFFCLVIKSIILVQLYNKNKKINNETSTDICISASQRDDKCPYSERASRDEGNSSVAVDFALFIEAQDKKRCNEWRI